MTGIERLNERLIELGANKSQLNGKVIPMMLEIFAEEHHGEDALDAYNCLLEIVDKERKKLDVEKFLFGNTQRDVYNKAHELDRRSEKLAEWENELAEQKKAIDKMLEMETAEARDKVRLLILFNQNSGDRRDMNEYQETAYIKGLGNVLGGGYEE